MRSRGATILSVFLRSRANLVTNSQYCSYNDVSGLGLSVLLTMSIATYLARNQATVLTAHPIAALVFVLAGIG